MKIHINLQINDYYIRTNSNTSIIFIYNHQSHWGVLYMSIFKDIFMNLYSYELYKFTERKYNFKFIGDHYFKNLNNLIT